MEITNDLVNHIAHLAKLEFHDNEKEAIRQDMSKIVKFMSKLNEVGTENVEPLMFMSHEINVLREDEPQVSITKEQALKNAPKKDSDYFRIPKVLHGK
ncbi:MAG TPA: Asp-tRNA(Asn)/Glu-tRNA(Gln) amidotransferase subunit GatC [Crocinitomicaceae bacterium]|jgi:aspartyl-tRNA(Asn)/glutamyl-tRNA(Gln) amidotransferase subunit C|nr:Asp-tRNA(Asn)/Glu-tRNA(Gln) amidotransferase subunit GatC [Crocinitomicaceae bacterium]